MSARRVIRLITDTDVIIRLHEAELWRVVCREYGVAVPGSIVHQEAQFYRDASGHRHEIHLQKDVRAGRITEVDAGAELLALLADRLTDAVLEQLHPGESEALALILAGEAREAAFVTGDKAAIQVLAMLGLAERGVSLEALLRRIGRSLPVMWRGRQFSEGYFREHIRRGQTRRLTDDGLRR